MECSVDLFFFQTRNATVMEETTLKVEFGFLIPGQVYCAVANFTAEGVLDSSPMSLPQCVHIPAKIGVHHYTQSIYMSIKYILLCGVMMQSVLGRLLTNSNQILIKNYMTKM